jgi:hypothetical protein
MRKPPVISTSRESFVLVQHAQKHRLPEKINLDGGRETRCASLKFEAPPIDAKGFHPHNWNAMMRVETGRHQRLAHHTPQ